MSKDVKEKSSKQEKKKEKPPKEDENSEEPSERLQSSFIFVKTFALSIIVVCISFYAFEFVKNYEIEIKLKVEKSEQFKDAQKISEKIKEIAKEKMEKVMKESAKVEETQRKIEEASKKVEESKPQDVAKNLNETQEVKAVEPEPKKRRPKYWFYMARGYMWIFYSVDNVLRRLGLEKIEIEVKPDEFVHNDWDLLWTYDYHNEIPIDFKQVKYHQRINHLPGNFVLTMKDNFAVNTQHLKYIPRAFNDTSILMKYAAKNKDKKFLQKLWSNRGIQMKKPDQMNFDVFGPGYKYFGQEYVEPPLLIDGYKFDFGIYVLVTSFDPLRVYIYEKNVLIRLCAEKYDPNDFSNLNTYVISDECLFPWDIDALSIYFNNSYTYKEAMNAYFTKQGYDVSKIWTQVDDCIREVLLDKEPSFKYWAHQYAYKHTFFELFRFDFLLDEDLNLFLIECNQSPNVNPSAVLWRDQRLFENVLFNVFTTIGVGSYIHDRETLQFGNAETEWMICHEEGWTVRPQVCVTAPCNRSCSNHDLCGLCKQCMTNNQRHELHVTYREVKNKGALKRIFPPSKDDLEGYGVDKYLNRLNPMNKWMTTWFMEMCKKDRDFC